MQSPLQLLAAANQRGIPPFRTKIRQQHFAWPRGAGAGRAAHKGLQPSCF